MYDLIVGNGKFTNLIIESLLEKHSYIMLLAPKDDLDNINLDRKVIKKPLNIKNSKMVKEAVSDSNFSKIIVYTDNDMLTLMLSESLQNFNNVYAIFNSSNVFRLTNNTYKSIYLDKILQFCFDKEIC